MLPRLDALLQALLDKPLRARDAAVRALLLIGLYQLQHMRVPAHAAIDQTVRAAEALGEKWAKGLVNAVLRNAVRRAAALAVQLAENCEFRHAHPAWLCEAFERDWPAHFAQIIAAGNQRPPLWLRVNRQKIATAEYAALLREVGIDCEGGALSAHALRLKAPVSVGRLPRFADGFCSVQDAAAQCCAGLLDLRPRQRVLDACAAPGGKTGHLLETCPAIALTAVDVSAERLECVAANLQRLQFSAKLMVADAAEPGEWWDGQPFARILLDAPCSASGVIRRHPDIKLVRRAADIARFARQQRRLLEGLWPLLAPDGLLLYVTCSIMPAENEGQMADFLAQQSDAQAVPINRGWGLSLAVGTQLLPQVDGADGFYFALLRKTGGGG